MQCPVCTRPAENLTPNTLDGVVVGCDHCGDYRVSGTAFYGLTRRCASARGGARGREAGVARGVADNQ